MIAYIKGRITEKDPTHVTIDVGGIGYQVKITLHTFSELKALDECKLYTHLQIKEDAHTLYGFFEASERKRFLQLISISGVGASIALMILSSLSAAEIHAAIVHGDTATISSVKGIGKKTAERIILELKDKMSKEEAKGEMDVISLAQHGTVKPEALAALTTLGINRTAAEKAITKILKAAPDNISLEELIRLVLKST